MNVKSAPLAISTGLACIAPLSWAMFLFSNRDPFLLGALLLIFLVCAPTSAIALGLTLRKAKSRSGLLWGLFALNAAIPVVVVSLLAYGWLSSPYGSGF
jgi:hypothetical protein